MHLLHPSCTQVGFSSLRFTLHPCLTVLIVEGGDLSGETNCQLLSPLSVKRFITSSQGTHLEGPEQGKKRIQGKQVKGTDALWNAFEH
jgi:hypothetical protein